MKNKRDSSSGGNPLKGKANKYIKILGNIITVIAIVFVIKRLMSSGYDYSQLFVAKNIIPILTIVIVQSVMVITNAFPWKLLIEMLTDRKVPFGETIPVYVMANLMKYVPGNVFQYVGRNQIAVKNKLPHLQVATATVLDVGMTVLAAALISIFFLFDYIMKFIQNSDWMRVVAFAFLVVGIVVVLFLIIFRKKIATKFKKYHYLMSAKSLKTIFVALVYYIIVLMISSLMYLIVVVFILDTPLTARVFLQLFSAYTLAWLVGFITPGAPGGIGVKEAVMLGVTGGYLGVDVITLSMVIIRILLIIADCVAFAMGKTYEYIKKKKEENENASYS